MAWVVDRVEARQVKVMKWVETPADIANYSKEAKEHALWMAWREANPDAIVGMGGGCSRNHMGNMPGVVDEEYCGTCGTDLGIPPLGRKGAPDGR